MSASRWVLITGEYPPEPGGVSDYSRLVARGLAAAGDEVHVWTPARRSSQAVPRDPGVTLHSLPGKFGRRDLEALDRGLRRLGKPYRLLVQYVPHAFGCKGMNVPFCWWLSRRPEPVWVMFHEVVFPLSTRQPVSHNFLGVVTRLMAHLVARKAERIFVSIPAWEAFLPKCSKRRVEWLPVPSNIATTVSAAEIGAVRGRFAASDEVILGHFGTYGSHVGSLLARILPALVSADSRRRALLIGKGSDVFGAGLLLENPALRGRIAATGPLDHERTPTHLAACDCLVQPYPDGVSSRRGSLMAGLALGLPIVTNAGPLTDAVWRESDAVALAASPAPSDFMDAVEHLLAEPRGMEELGRRAAEMYQKRFALVRTIETLRSGLGDNEVAA
ncbi:MAG TPA: glycosyltransferase family 4 protein [Gemmataceae bacterium]